MDINFVAFANKIIDTVEKETKIDLNNDRDVIINDMSDNDTIEEIAEISGCEIDESEDYTGCGYYYNMVNGTCISVVDFAYDMIECIEDNTDIDLNEELRGKLLNDIRQIIMETLSPFREVIVVETNKPGLPEQIAIPASLTCLDDMDIINEYILNVARSYNAEEIYLEGLHEGNYIMGQVPCTEELKKQLDISDEFLSDIDPDREME